MQARPWIIVIIFAVVSLGLASGIFRSIERNYRLSQTLKDRQMVVERLERKHDELENSLFEATQSSFVEREARDKLGLIREGEVIVLAPRFEASSSSGSHVEATMSSNWQQWWDRLGW
jgi:cell division protein FtsB